MAKNEEDSSNVNQPPPSQADAAARVASACRLRSAGAWAIATQVLVAVADVANLGDASLLRAA